MVINREHRPILILKENKKYAFVIIFSLLIFQIFISSGRIFALSNIVEQIRHTLQFLFFGTIFVLSLETMFQYAIFFKYIL